MSNLLTAELQKYYTREGNRLLFANGMTLNQLALEMWEKEGCRGVDASVVSRVISGERLFTYPQLLVFFKIMNLSKTEKIKLENSLLLSLGLRFGIKEDNQDNFVVTPEAKPKEMNINRVEHLCDDYFSSVVGKKIDQFGSRSFFNEWIERFFDGKFEDLLEDLNKFEQYLRFRKIDKEKGGINWFAATSAIRANVLTHSLPRSELLAKPLYCLGEIEKFEKIPEKNNPLISVAICNWASLMRLTGEAVFEEGNSPDLAFDLLTKSMQIRKENLNKISVDDFLRITALTELMAVSSDLQFYFPEKSASFLKKEDAPRVYYEKSLEAVERSGSKSASQEACAYEFKARWAIRGGGFGNNFIDENMDLLDKAQKIIDHSGLNDGVIDTNTAVTRLNLYKIVGEKPPEKVQEKALRLVIKNKDNEQGYRLLTGN